MQTVFTGYIDPFGVPQTITWGGAYTPGYDPAGVLRSYFVHVYNPANEALTYTSTYELEYLHGNTYLETGQTVGSTAGGPLPGETSRQYNANYELVATIDERDPTRNRYFANDSSGNAITAIKGKFDGQGTLTAPQAFAFALSNSGGFNFTKAQHFFYANGQAVGSFGQLTENGQFKANFDVNYTPVSATYPAIAPAEIVVQFKDTLRILAQRVWGDGNLWYLLAEENGLTSPDDELEPGTVLRVPNDVVSLSNTASSFKPFEARAVIGDTTPYQPAPPVPTGKKGCGTFGRVLMIAVAVVISIFVPPAAPTVWQMVGVGALAATASQSVGLATGVIDKFSFKDVAIGALTAGVTQGVSAAGVGAKAATALGFADDGLAAAAINAALSSSIVQGVSVATGLQEKFSWREVAMSAAAAPASASVATNVANKFAGGFTSTLAGAAVRASLGGKVDTVSVIADAFGNALGNSVVARGRRTASSDQTSGEVNGASASAGGAAPALTGAGAAAPLSGPRREPPDGIEEADRNFEPPVCRGAQRAFCQSLRVPEG